MTYRANQLIIKGYDIVSVIHYQGMTAFWKSPTRTRIRQVVNVIILNFEIVVVNNWLVIQNAVIPEDVLVAYGDGGKDNWCLL